MTYVKCKNQTILHIFDFYEVSLKKSFRKLSDSQILIFAMNPFLRVTKCRSHNFSAPVVIRKRIVPFRIVFNIDKANFITLFLHQNVIKLLLSISSASFLKVIILCQQCWLNIMPILINEFIRLSISNNSKFQYTYKYNSTYKLFFFLKPY